MNRFIKYKSLVFIAKCEQEYKKGEEITVITRDNREHLCKVYNRIIYKNPKHKEYFYYSVENLDEPFVKYTLKGQIEKLNTWIDSNIKKREKILLSLEEVGELDNLHYFILHDLNENIEKFKLSNIYTVLWENKNKKRLLQQFLKYIKIMDKIREFEKRKHKIIQKIDAKNDLSKPESLKYYEYLIKDISNENQHNCVVYYSKEQKEDINNKHKIAIELWG